MTGGGAREPRAHSQSPVDSEFTATQQRAGDRERLAALRRFDACIQRFGAVFRALQV